MHSHSYIKLYFDACEIRGTFLESLFGDSTILSRNRGPCYRTLSLETPGTKNTRVHRPSLRGAQGVLMASGSTVRCPKCKSHPIQPRQLGPRLRVHFLTKLLDGSCQGKG